MAKSDIRRGHWSNAKSEAGATSFRRWYVSPQVTVWPLFFCRFDAVDFWIFNQSVDVDFDNMILKIFLGKFGEFRPKNMRI